MKIHQHLIGTLALLTVLLTSALSVTPAYAATGATFVISGSNLTLDLMSGVSVSISTNSSTYTLTLNGANTWSGTDGSGVTGNGTGALSVTAAGAYTAINITDSGTGASVTFSDSGGLTYTKSFNVSLDNGSGTVTINGDTNIPSSGSTFSVTAPAINMNGSVTTFDGAQTYNGPITLGANALPTGIIGGDITFNGTIDGAYSLTVYTGGMTTFKDSIGTVTPLTGLMTDAAGTTKIQLNGAGASTIITNGPQTYNDPVAIVAGAILNAFTSGPSLGDMTFASTLENGGSSGQALLTADNLVAFDGAVGATTPLFALQILSSASNQVLINTDTIRVSSLLSISTNMVVNSPPDSLLIRRPRFPRCCFAKSTWRGSNLSS